MSKARPLNQVRSIDADMLNHIAKLQNKSVQAGSILSLLAVFASSIPDFRRSGKGNFRHPLSDIVMLTLLGRICGCTSRADIMEFGEHNINKMRKKLSDKRKGMAELMRHVSMSFAKLMHFLNQK